MTPWFVGDGYNKAKNYYFIWAMYQNSTVGKVYTKLEERQDIHINGDEQFYPIMIKKIGAHVMVTQRLREEAHNDDKRAN